MVLQIGWLTDLTAWLWRIVTLVWQAFVDFMDDFYLTVLDKTLSVVLYALSLLPYPEFLQNYSFGQLLAQAGSPVIWFAQMLQIPQALSVIATGMIFYVMRRLLTLGVW